jgi:hypothetical protein
MSTREGGTDVYMTKTIQLAQEVFGGLSSFEPDSLLASLDGVETMGAAAAALHLIDVLPVEQREPMAGFLASIPPSIDTAVIAAIRSSLARGLPVGISWQPGYDFELRVWDVSAPQGEGDPWAGMVNVHLVSPHPDEATPAS